MGSCIDPQYIPCMDFVRKPLESAAPPNQSRLKPIYVRRPCGWHEWSSLSLLLRLVTVNRAIRNLLIFDPLRGSVITRQWPRLPFDAAKGFQLAGRPELRNDSRRAIVSHKAFVVGVREQSPGTVDHSRGRRRISPGLRQFRCISYDR